jgi:hypothetical protein
MANKKPKSVTLKIDFPNQECLWGFLNWSGGGGEDSYWENNFDQRITITITQDN